MLCRARPVIIVSSGSTWHAVAIARKPSNRQFSLLPVQMWDDRAWKERSCTAASMADRLYMLLWLWGCGESPGDTVYDENFDLFSFLFQKEQFSALIALEFQVTKQPLMFGKSIQGTWREALMRARAREKPKKNNSKACIWRRGNCHEPLQMLCRCLAKYTPVGTFS